MPDVRTPATLVCVECLHADGDGDARGWRADWAGATGERLGRERVAQTVRATTRDAGRVERGIPLAGPPAVQVQVAALRRRDTIGVSLPRIPP